LQICPDPEQVAKAGMGEINIMVFFNWFFNQEALLKRFRE
jgi:hypothetical protein